MSFSNRFYWPRIRRALLRGDQARARRLARHYARFYPEDARAWTSLAIVLEKEDDAQAEAILREGLRRYPAPEITLKLASILMRQGQFQEARDLLNELIERQPDSPFPYLGFADLALYQRSWDQARQQALRALSAASTPWDRFEVAKRLVDTPGGQERAIQLLKGFVRESPKQPLAHMMLSVLLEERHPSESKKYLHAARKALGRDSSRLERGVQALRTRLSAAESS